MTEPAPMTAEEIRDRMERHLATADDDVQTIIETARRILDWMAAREREDAELAELKRQIGEMGARLRTVELHEANECEHDWVRARDSTGSYHECTRCGAQAYD